MGGRRADDPAGQGARAARPAAGRRPGALRRSCSSRGLTGPSPVDRGRTGSEHHLIVDPSGPTEHGSGLGRMRWVVERTFAWLHQFRRLRIRWERRPELHQAFMHLACAFSCQRFHQSFVKRALSASVTLDTRTYTPPHRARATAHARPRDRPRLSPDGRWLVHEKQRGDVVVALVDLAVGDGAATRGCCGVTPKDISAFTSFPRVGGRPTADSSSSSTPATAACATASGPSAGEPAGSPRASECSAAPTCAA